MHELGFIDHVTALSVGLSPHIPWKDLFEEVQHAWSTLKHLHVHSLCVVLECHLQHAWPT